MPRFTIAYDMPTTVRGRITLDAPDEDAAMQAFKQVPTDTLKQGVPFDQPYEWDTDRCDPEFLGADKAAD